MLETIKAYLEDKANEVKLIQLVRSDDGTFVFFRSKFDPLTGLKLPDEVITTMTEKAITAEISNRESEIATLQNFLKEVGAQ